ncbi:MAG TPA: MJ0042-type zinc finger domain-containing protein [Gemmataceae bacterium]|nr:MJ0042-type zinc finger domain-containing protein [Gemmataceae bacterium]
MLRLLTATCPKCGNAFRVEVESDGLPAGRECRCPRCYSFFAVPADAGEPRSAPLGWAIRATATDPPAAPSIPGPESPDPPLSDPPLPIPLPAPPGPDVPTAPHPARPEIDPTFAPDPPPIRTDQ